jgi:hypothetical protein
VIVSGGYVMTQWIDQATADDEPLPFVGEMDPVMVPLDCLPDHEELKAPAVPVPPVFA